MREVILVVLLSLTGCIALHAPGLEEFLEEHASKRCQFADVSYGAGARVCMEGERMQCKHSGEWTVVGECPSE